MCSGDPWSTGRRSSGHLTYLFEGRLRAGRVDLRRPRARAPGRGHPILAETVRLVADAGGVLLVPSFAIGRTQEVVWELDRLIERGEIPSLPLYLDSPMATKATLIYRRYSQYFEEETARLLRDGATPLDYPAQIVVNTPKESGAIQFATRPYLIVASNGMLTGGRVVGHLRNLIDDPNATLLFVGYQGRDTRRPPAGRRQDGAPRWAARARSAVRRSPGSRRTPTSELLDWSDVRRASSGGKASEEFLVHGGRRRPSSRRSG